MEREREREVDREQREGERERERDQGTHCFRAHCDTFLLSPSLFDQQVCVPRDDQLTVVEFLALIRRYEDMRRGRLFANMEEVSWYRKNG